jgi:radical SAM-linked protein
MAPQRVPEGPPPPPAVQKLRVRYAKRGRLRFSSTRDFSRAIERALRRSGVPMAFSAGFHPHPKISYANGAQTGAASEAEYFEISVVERVDPESVRAALDEALPDGLDVLEVVEARTGSLADRLEASSWRVELPGVRAEDAMAGLQAFLALPVAEVTRTFKTGPKTFDVRPAVLDARVDPVDGSTTGGMPCAILTMVVRHTTPATRPDDVLTALRAIGFVPATPPRVTRLAQGPLTATAGVADPLAADMDTVAP